MHTIVRVVYYMSHQRDRQGLCSGHLGERAPEGSTMPIFLHSNNNFRLPENTDTPVIMIGPGTGIAPFRAFLQHRKAHGHKGDNWLFFGEQRRASDFLYREDLEGMFKDGILTRFDTAFSRDQSHKVYVQDRMRENDAELFRWLECGAHFMYAVTQIGWRKMWRPRCWTLLPTDRIVRRTQRRNISPA